MANGPTQREKGERFRNLHAGEPFVIPIVLARGDVSALKPPANAWEALDD